MTSPASITATYQEFQRKKALFLFLIFAVLLGLILYAIAVGSYGLSLRDVLRTLLGQGEGPMKTVIWNIRIPRIVSAVIAGCGLALSGTVFQCLLKNPLASASTLGISHGAAFGAAFAIVVLEPGLDFCRRRGAEPDYPGLPAAAGFLPDFEGGPGEKNAPSLSI